MNGMWLKLAAASLEGVKVCVSVAPTHEDPAELARCSREWARRCVTYARNSGTLPIYDEDTYDTDWMQDVHSWLNVSQEDR